MGNMTVEPIRSDILALYFEDAEALGISIKPKDYKAFSNQDYALSNDGKVYLNKSSEGYNVLLWNFSEFSDMSVDKIREMYDVLDRYYPNDNEIKDMCKYKDFVDIKNVARKAIMKIEIDRREKGSNFIKSFIFQISTKL